MTTENITEIIEIKKDTYALDFSSVLARSWTRFINTFLPLLGVFGISVIIIIVAIIVLIGFGVVFFLKEQDVSDITNIILLGVLFFVWLAAVSWIMSVIHAMYYNALAHKKLFKEIWNMSVPKGLGLLGVGAVVGFATMGGALLFIIPGIWIGTLLMFAALVYTLENKTWQDSLRKSILLVKDNFFVVFLPIFVIGLAVGIIGMFPFLGIINIFAGMFIITIVYELYISLSQKYPLVDQDIRTQSLTVVGIFASIAGLAGLVFFVITTFLVLEFVAFDDIVASIWWLASGITQDTMGL